VIFSQIMIYLLSALNVQFSQTAKTVAMLVACNGHLANLWSDYLVPKKFYIYLNFCRLFCAILCVL